MHSVESEARNLELRLKEEKEFWTKRLAVEPGCVGLPLDQKRPEEFLQEEASVKFILPRDVYQRLLKLTGNSSFLTYVTLVAAIKICILKYNSVRTIAIGSPLMKEMDRADALSIVDEVNASISFRQFLQGVRETLLQAYRRQHYPLNEIVKALGLENFENRCALFDIVVRLDSLHGDLPLLKNDLTFSFTEAKDQLEGEIKYREALFQRGSIERFRDNFVRILSAGLREPDAPVHSLPIISDEERSMILNDWSYRKADYVVDKCVHQLFEDQVEDSPDVVAVTFEKESLTYQQLNRRANMLASFLRRLEIGPESFVGICLERSIDLVVAMLAVLKAGAAYVPLDPDYPKERLALVIDDTAAQVVITHKHLVDRLPDRTAVFPDAEEIGLESNANPQVDVDLQNAAYVLYTSGSTGRPKGVSISHQTLSNHMLWFQQAFQLTEADRVMQRTSISFDASVWEFFAPLISGGQLILARPREHVDSMYLVRLIADQQISIIQLVPSVLRMLVSEPGFQSLSSLRRIFCGGEALSTELLAAVASGSAARICNLYGPTEATIDTIFWEFNEDLDEGAVPIGRPIADCRVYLLDDYLELVPVGGTGEIFIGGNVLARGYMNQPELTAEKFIPDPFSPWSNARMYRTGDSARYLAHGIIQFLGRKDSQVKLRGHRIELGEIESILRSYPSVGQAVVVISDQATDERRLLAFVIPRNDDRLTSDELRDYMQKKLPAYMVPGQYIVRNSFPLLANGKVDRRALSVARDPGPALKATFVAPQNELEQVIARLWQETIPVERVGRNENFFDLGGHSLSILEVRAKLQRLLERELSIVTLFEYPTVSSLAEHLAKIQNGSEAETVRANSDGIVSGKSRLKRQLKKAQSSRLQVQNE
jgi:amino acid adenylation domain-containing protein